MCHKITLFICTMLLISTSAYAQKTKAQLQTEIITQFPDNTTGLITPSILRSVTTDMVNSSGTLLDLNTFSNAITLNPTALSLNQALIINQSLSGTQSTGNEYGLSNITITSDNANCSTSCLAINDLLVQHTFGGAATQGGRNGVFAFLTQTAATSPSNTNLNYVALTGISLTNSGDGGTNTGAGARGAYFGANPQARSNGGTNVLALEGTESDVFGTSASTQKYVMGHSAVSLHVNQGASMDAAYEIHSGTSSPYGPGGGFNLGLVFAELNNGLVPISANGTLIGTHLESLSSVNVTNGIDFRKFNFSGSAFLSPGFGISGTGAISATGSILLNATSVYDIAFSQSGTLQNLIGQAFSSNDWATGSAAGDLVIRSQGNSIDFSANSGTSIQLKISGTNVLLPIVATGTPVASLCLDASNNIIKKTTAGSCI